MNVSLSEPPADSSMFTEVSPDAYQMNRKTQTRLAVFASFLALVAVAYASYWLLHLRFIESTDNAYVRADTVIISSQLAGRIDQVRVNDNQWVEAGETLAHIEDADFKFNVVRSETQIANLGVQLDDLSNQGDQQLASIEAQQAAIRASQAELKRHQQNLERIRKMRTNGFASEQALSSLSANVAVAQARLDQAKSALKGQKIALAQLDNRRQQLKTQITGRKNELHLAELNLSRTTLTAPVAGRVGNRSLNLGEYVRPGEALLSLVPQTKWIQANFKETQIDSMRKGYKAQLRFDALPNLVIEGVIDSLQPATGSQFSLLPPDNATGNFTKVIQRVPVKILLPEDFTELEQIRPGLSVEVAVDRRQ
ncbi:hypothetical protein B9K09_19470 [Pseudomonas sp. M30-35]|nr:hypothetical protein B9K09_19470 [Pseudomonas sp. M30-35]